MTNYRSNYSIIFSKLENQSFTFCIFELERDRLVDDDAKLFNYILHFTLYFSEKLDVKSLSLSLFLFISLLKFSPDHSAASGSRRPPIHHFFYRFLPVSLVLPNKATTFVPSGGDSFNVTLITTRLNQKSIKYPIKYYAQSKPKALRFTELWAFWKCDSFSTKRVEEKPHLIDGRRKVV